MRNKNGLILQMNYTLTERNILGKKYAEVGFDSILTIVAYIP
jgi:hypothetical protein